MSACSVQTFSLIEGQYLLITVKSEEKKINKDKLLECNFLIMA